MASAFGIKSFHLSSFNPIELLKKCIKYFKNIDEPIFIEVDTYRYLEHCGPNRDDHLNYRPKKLMHWFNNDPLLITENYTLKKKICTEKNIKEIKFNIDRSIKNAFIFAENSNPPRYKDYERLVLK